jgi:hypothetical protein
VFALFVDMEASPGSAVESIGSLVPTNSGTGIASLASVLSLTPYPALDKRLFNLDAVLVSQEEVVERNASLGEIRSKMEEAERDVTYNLHRKDTEWGEQLKLQKDEFELMLTAERTRYMQLHLVAFALVLFR